MTDTFNALRFKEIELEADNLLDFIRDCRQHVSVTNPKSAMVSFAGHLKAPTERIRALSRAAQDAGGRATVQTIEADRLRAGTLVGLLAKFPRS